MQFRRSILVLAVAGVLAACSDGDAPMAEVPEQSKSESASDEGASVTEAEPVLMTWTDLLSRERPEPTRSMFWGPEEHQVVDVWMPEGDGPHPVVLMVHGGCWQKAIADRTLMNYAAEDLRQRGIAVWNIEYRGVDEEGGGYPGTFIDVTQAAQPLFQVGEQMGFDTSRVVGFGHSAGGHLITWLDARSNLSPDSAAYSNGQVYQMKAVINSGGLADLEASSPVTLDTCLAAIEDKLTGTADDDRPDVYADTSSARLQPGGSRQISVNGTHDRIAPPELGKGFTTRVEDKGGKAQYVEIPDSGHVELISPGTDAWEMQVALIKAALED